MSNEPTDLITLNARGLREVPPAVLESREDDLLVMLNDNLIEILPERLTAHPTISSLYLYGNPLREVPAALFRMAALNDLSLADTPLTRLPLLTEPGRKLRTLILDKMRWLTLEEGFFAKLPELRALSLTMSNLSALPRDIFDLRELVQLDVAGNPLTVLPDEIGQLAHLRILNLEKCKLKTLPKALSKVTGLAEWAKKASVHGLRLRGNPFKDKALKEISKLEQPERTIQALDWARHHGSE